MSFFGRDDQRWKERLRGDGQPATSDLHTFVFHFGRFPAIGVFGQDMVDALERKALYLVHSWLAFTAPLTVYIY